MILKWFLTCIMKKQHLSETVCCTTVPPYMSLLSTSQLQLYSFPKTSGFPAVGLHKSVSTNAQNSQCNKELEVCEETAKHKLKLTSMSFLLTGFKKSCPKASSAVHLLEGLNMSICFNKLIADRSAAGYNDSRLRPGFFSRLLMYSLA